MSGDCCGGPQCCGKNEPKPRISPDQLAALTAKERGLERAHLAGPWADDQDRIRAVLISLADAKLGLAEREKAVASLRQSLTVMQPLYEAQRDTVAKLEAEVARRTEGNWLFDEID